MWVFTRYGFYSVVCARVGDGAHGNPLDPTQVMVRARRRAHLDNLLKRFEGLLPAPLVIHDDKGTDYAYRVFLPKATWAEIAKALANDLDYDNFKDAAHAHPDDTAEGRCYTEALGEVWEVMAAIQDE